jgi:hypothetical protein
MTTRLTRTSWGGGHAPDIWGVEVDDAGRAAAWQTSGHRVGRFARDLSERERDALDHALADARAAQGATSGGFARGVTPPSGTTEQLAADGLSDVVVDPHDDPPAGFGQLFALLRTLREDLAESPLAAIELEVTGSPLAARLRHLGSEPVAVRMGRLSVQATMFDADSAIVESMASTVDASTTNSPVGPGWTLPLAEDLGLAAPPPGGFLTVTVASPEVDSLGDGVLRPAEFGWITE